MVSSKAQETRSIVLRGVVITVALIVALKLTMPHRSLIRESVAAVLAIGGAVALTLHRRRQKNGQL